jgi:phenylpropionate dioxygenase-like ring-hydroxylating dioxygenase large terminal subunit
MTCAARAIGLHHGRGYADTMAAQTLYISPAPDKAHPETLVRSDHVHRSVYTDPEIFALEMVNIFARAWIYLAHESELPNPGDYVLRHMGTQAVVLTRGRDGAVHAIPNRCSHRGATLCAFDRGTAPAGHICPYHGWNFAADGKLRAVPHRVNYDGVLELTDYDIAPVRLERYRGFLFGTLDPEAGPLAAFLGHMKTSIDDLVDRSPTGEVICSPYALRHHYRANWKLAFENLNDTIHPGFAHSASVVSARAVAEQLASEEPLAASLGMMLANGKPIQFFQKLDMVTTPGGHSYIGGHMGADYSPDTQSAYAQALIAHHGAEKAAKVLGTDRHLMLLYPSSTWHARYQTVRIIRPVRHDLTEIIGYTFRLPGAPEETYRNAVEYCTGANSAASPVIADDLELYERIMLGNGTDRREWIPMSRGLREDREINPELRRTPATSEAFIRNQFAAWATYMEARR